MKKNFFWIATKIIAMHMGLKTETIILNKDVTVSQIRKLEQLGFIVECKQINMENK